MDGFRCAGCHGWMLCTGSLKVALTQLEPQEPHFSCVAQAEV